MGCGWKHSAYPIGHTHTTSSRVWFWSCLRFFAYWPINSVLNSLVVVFTKSIDEVRHCKALVVNRTQYLDLLQLRSQFRDAFANVEIDLSTAFTDTPDNGVPESFLQHAVGLPEAKFVTMQSEASQSNGIWSFWMQSQCSLLPQWLLEDA